MRSALGRRGEIGTTKRTTSAALLSTGRWPSGPDLTRRCRRHPPRLRLLTHTVQVIHSLAKGRETDRADASERQACPPGGACMRWPGAVGCVGSGPWLMRYGRSWRGWLNWTTSAGSGRWPRSGSGGAIRPSPRTWASLAPPRGTCGSTEASSTICCGCWPPPAVPGMSPRRCGWSPARGPPTGSWTATRPRCWPPATRPRTWRWRSRGRLRKSCGPAWSRNWCSAVWSSRRHRGSRAGRCRDTGVIIRCTNCR